MIPHYSPCSGYTTSQNDWVSLGRETFLRNLSLLNHEQACYCKQQGTDPEKMTSQRVTSTDECFSGKPDSAFLEYHSISKFHQALQHCNSVLICCTSLGGMLQFLLTFFPALFFFFKTKVHYHILQPISVLLSLLLPLMPLSKASLQLPAPVTTYTPPTCSCPDYTLRQKAFLSHCLV